MEKGSSDKKKRKTAFAHMTEAVVCLAAWSRWWWLFQYTATKKKDNT